MRARLAFFLVMSCALVAPLQADAASLDQPSVPPTETTSNSKEVTLVAVRAEPWPQGFVKVTLPDGEAMFIAEQRVLQIRDSAGGDLTNRVIQERERVEESGLEVSYLPANPTTRALRGQPKPQRRWFPVLQAGALVQLDQEEVRGEEGEGTMVLDLGAMQNVGDRSALGGSVYFGFDPDRARFGAKFRVRRWLTNSLSIDAAPGIVVGGTSEDGSRYYSYPGFVGELGLSLSDRVIVTGQVETRRVASRGFVAWAPTGRPIYGSGEETTEVSWYLGAKLGGELSLPGALLSIIVVGALVEQEVLIGHIF